MKKIVSVMLGIITVLSLSVTAFAGAPSPLEQLSEMMQGGGIWIIVAAGIALVALVVGIVLLATGKKR